MNSMFKQILIYILLASPVIIIVVIPEDTLSWMFKAIIIIVYLGIVGFILFRQLNQEALKLQKILLIGPSGVGKTQTYNYLKCKTMMSFNKFKLGKIGDICLVDSPTMDLETSISQREDTIQQFQQFFVNFKTSISAFLIVVNYERIDLMKQKLLVTHKYLRKFKDMTYILITDFHLSEDYDKDKQELQQQLSYLNAKGIIFLNKEENEKMIVDELNGIVHKQSHQEFDISDTIFAILDEKMNAQFMEQINLKITSNKQPST